MECILLMSTNHLRASSKYVLDAVVPRRPLPTTTGPSASSTCWHCWPTGARACERDHESHNSPTPEQHAE